MTGHVPRIPPAEPPDPQTAALLDGSAQLTGERLNIFGVLANHPALLKRYLLLGDLFLNRGLLPARERELVILRVGRDTGSAYEVQQHEILGRAAGLTDGEIAAVAQTAADDPRWAPREAALLAATDELCASDDLTDATWQRLRADWTDAELVELLLLVGFYRMTAGFLNAARVPLQ